MSERLTSTLAEARARDQNDSLAGFREKFHLPHGPDGRAAIYFCGNSLGLQPKATRQAITQELDDWASFGVEGHFQARHPWMPYHRFLTENTAALVGALPEEVVNMNSLTVNLHLMLVSFYRPEENRRKIIIEANPFPSDRYALRSQNAFHGYNPDRDLLELPLRPGETVHHPQDILEFIERHGPESALILIGGVNYYTGQVFDMKSITEAGHAAGCMVGFDLAHGAGNLALRLHDWGPDFAVWCPYKYLNSGPGSLSGCFVHQRHAHWTDMPRFAGWWGHDQETRFRMGPEFRAMPGAEGWQLSNPPILPLAAMRVSLEIFQEAGIDNLRRKSEQLTGYLSDLLKELGPDRVAVITPEALEQRGCQLSLVVKNNARAVFDKLAAQGVICDWREPDVIRIAPVPLYNTFEEAWRFAAILDEALG